MANKALVLTKTTSKPPKFDPAEKLKKAVYNAKQRCKNPHNPDYPNYGAAGIKFLLSGPAAVEAAIGLPKPTDTFDRIDPHGNYEIGNIRWANSAVQAANKKASPGGSHVSTAYLLHGFKLAREQTALREQTAATHGVLVQAINRGELRKTEAAWLDENAHHEGLLDWSHDISEIPWAGEGHGLFRLPSATIPGAIVTMRGGPFGDLGSELSEQETARRDWLTGRGLIRGFDAELMKANVPSHVIKWMKHDLQDEGWLGAYWHGQPTPGFERTGAVEGAMIAIASYLYGKEAACCTAVQIQELMHALPWPSDLEYSNHPVLTAPILFVPDFQVDAAAGWETPALTKQLARTMEYRVHAGRRTFLGIQNVRNLPPPVRKIVMLNLRERPLLAEKFSPHIGAEAIANAAQELKAATAAGLPAADDGDDCPPGPNRFGFERMQALGLGAQLFLKQS